MGASDLGGLLRGFRRRAGLTQDELAERAGLSTDAIGLLERGERRRPQRHTVQRLVAALDLPDADRERFLLASRGITGSVGPGLPIPATPLVGRADEVAAVVARLAEVRLVTLVGPGGVGKTRLAMAVAEQVAEQAEDAVVFVPLADLREPARLADELARVLGIPERAGQPSFDAVVAHLRAGRWLLVLDNFEHLSEAASTVADLLAACAEVRILVTSRIPLRLTAETRHTVPVLPTADTVASSPGSAVELFEQRARAAVPDFAVTPGNTSTVRAICRRLDGLPLAIELAAPWLRVLSPSDLLARLDQRLGMLAGGPVDLPSRQQNLRATLDWSHHLLSERERAMFGRLSVFAGGWTAEAAAAVCGATLTDLAALADKSLLGARPPRFWMLQTVHEYATDTPVARSEDTELRRAHSRYYLELAQHAELVGPQELTWTERLAAEDANLQAALDWAITTGEVEPAIAFARELWRFWTTSGRLRQASGWLAAIVHLADQAAPPLPALLREELYLWAGMIERAQGHHGQATELFERCLALRQQTGDTDTLTAAAHNLGIVHYEQGNLTQAAELERAAVAAARRTNSGYGLPFGLVSLGDVERALGDLPAAIVCYQEGLDLFHRMGHVSGIRQALVGLGHAARQAGDPARAAAHYRESLARAEGSGDPALTAECLEGLAAAETEPHQAVALLAAAATIRDQANVPVRPRDRTEHDNLTARLRQRLGPVDFTAAWQDGTNDRLTTVLAAQVSD